MDKVTDIGGVFIKAKNPKELVAWYQKHLGSPLTGTAFRHGPLIPLEEHHSLLTTHN
jgi:hypothetical protein